jgi:uncharacterized protein YecT (DUF1311 family)
MLLRMTKVWLAWLLLLVSATHVSGQPEDANAQTKTACNGYLKTPLPAEASQIATPTEWPDCNSYRLYYGIGVTVDYSAARQCAWSERLAIQANKEPRLTNASIFGGSAMLSTVYANGEGVERNVPLAIRFACEQGWAPAEFELRVQHLQSLIEKPEGGKRFGFCDDITSGAMDGFCAGLNAEIAAGRRNDAMRNLSPPWPRPQQVQFDTLVKAEDSYAEAHANSETDMSGTIHSARAIGVEEHLRDLFVAGLQSFENGHLPRGSASDFAREDAELNLLYRKARAAAEAHKNGWLGAIQPEGIQRAERAWLSYRDAWVAFAKSHYPSTDSNAWLTMLTANRVASLRMTLCQIDSDDSLCSQKPQKPTSRAVP